MIKKKLLALGLSATAVTAVVGAGFSSWYFGDSVKSTETNLGITVTAAYEFGTITVAADAPDTVVLDQSNILLKNGSDAKTEIVANWVVNNDAYTNATTGTNSLTYTAHVYIKGTSSSGLAKYINGGTAVTASGDTAAMTGYVHYTAAVTTSVATATNDTTVTMTVANPFTYADEPENFAEYQAMVNEINDTIANDSDVAQGTDYDIASSAKPVIIVFEVTKTASGS